MSHDEKIRRTRRAFLRTVGAAAAALPFYSMLENEVVRGQTGMLPQKFVGVGTFHATSQRFYARRAGETDTSYDIGYADCALRPFDDAATYGSSFKDDLIVFEGFDYGVGELGPDGGELHVNMHGALALMLTGSSARSGSELNFELQNESLDQYLAGRFGGETRYRSVQLTNEADLGGLYSAFSISCGPGGALMGRMTSPEEIFDTYFAALMAPDDGAARRRRAIGASVLDFVAADLNRLSLRVGSAERAKLDQHLTVVRDMERRLEASGGAGCMLPTRHPERGNPDPADDYVVSNANNGGLPYFDRICDMQIELLAQLLACDLTRFATIVIAGTPGVGTPATSTPLLVGDGETDAAVGTDMELPADFHNLVAHVSGDDRLEVQRAVASMTRYYNGKVARLMQRLREAGALDSTLILVGNEGGDGAGHHTRNVPLLLAGGAQGAIRMGRRVVAPGRTAQIGAEPTGREHTSHNPILVGIANALGAGIDRFGTCADTSLTEGIDGLL